MGAIIKGGKVCTRRVLPTFLEGPRSQIKKGIVPFRKWRTAAEVSCAQNDLLYSSTFCTQKLWYGLQVWCSTLRHQINS